MLRLFSWNINGIRAAQKRGLLAWIESVSPDILCLQETKAHPTQLDPDLVNPPGYRSYWAAAVRPGYSGVAVYSKLEPVSVQLGLGIPSYDDEGRTIVLSFEDFVFIGAYFPNGGQDNSRVPFKLAYCTAFLDFCDRLRAEGRAVIFCGDVNTAHRPIDLAHPERNAKSTGFLPEERAWLDEVVRRGYVDIYRALNPDLRGAYTWWPFWSQARERNVGWRIDYFFITPDLRERVIAADIHPDVMGSDHCPVSLTLA